MMEFVIPQPTWQSSQDYQKQFNEARSWLRAGPRLRRLQMGETRLLLHIWVTGPWVDELPRIFAERWPLLSLEEVDHPIRE